MNFDYLKALREAELQTVLQTIAEAPCRLLEVGAGSGWQAAALAEHGYEVSAVDIEQETGYQEARVFPVRSYDGEHLPFDDHTFDAIFSSHVMEHVQCFEELQAEMQRVLSREGRAYHIIPNSLWRIATLVTHYPAMAKEIYLKFFGTHLKGARKRTAGERRAFTDMLLRAVAPHRHGERGNAWSEIFFFSRHFWTENFRNCGWEVQAVIPVGVLYSGYALFANNIPIPGRVILGSALGSSAYLYLLKKAE